MLLRYKVRNNLSNPYRLTAWDFDEEPENKTTSSYSAIDLHPFLPPRHTKKITVDSLQLRYGREKTLVVPLLVLHTK